MSAALYAASAPSGDDYLVVDFDTGKIAYEGLLASQDASNVRYNTAEYKTGKMVLRKVPAGGTYPTGDGEGGKFALWNDISGNGISEDDTFDRVFPAVQTLSQKMWSGARSDQGWEEFCAVADLAGEAPGVNQADRLTGPGMPPSPQDRAVGWTQNGLSISRFARLRVRAAWFGDSRSGPESGRPGAPHCLPPALVV